ncbi:hypothetical protein F4804DRAFT_330073 [Jackrogersella minutella]|nr:hypothetical protein F4804DRAFT_330073 [Jackrogersella minutella]
MDRSSSISAAVCAHPISTGGFLACGLFARPMEDTLLVPKTHPLHARLPTLPGKLPTTESQESDLTVRKALCGKIFKQIAAVGRFKPLLITYKVYKSRNYITLRKRVRQSR